MEPLQPLVPDPNISTDKQTSSSSPHLSRSQTDPITQPQMSTSKGPPPIHAHNSPDSVNGIPPVSCSQTISSAVSRAPSPDRTKAKELFDSISIEFDSPTEDLPDSIQSYLKSEEQDSAMDDQKRPTVKDVPSAGVVKKTREKSATRLSSKSSPKYQLPPGFKFESRNYNADVEGGSDLIVKSKKVYKLSSGVFDSFLEVRDAVLVLFYDEGMKLRTSINSMAKKNFIKAAENTTRPNTAYATIDCTKSGQLCEEQSINRVPMYKLYSKGIPIGSIEETSSLTSKVIKEFVENAPVPKFRTSNKYQQ